MRDYARIFQFVARSQTQASETRARRDGGRTRLRCGGETEGGHVALARARARESVGRLVNEPSAASLWMRRATSRVFHVDFIINSLASRIVALHENNLYN